MNIETASAEVRKPHYNFLLSWLVTPFYIVFFFGILLFFHPVLVLARLRSRDAFFEALAAMCRAILNNLYLTAGIVISYSKLQKLPTDRPLLIVSNHQSMYDIPIIIDIFFERHPRFVSKRELAKWIPSVAFALRNNGSALIDRDDRDQSLAEIRRVAKEVVAENGSLCLFPEGTRSRNGVVRTFRTGGFSAVLEEVPNAIIVPVAIGRSWEVLRYQLLPIPAKVKISVRMLDPIEVTDQNPTELLATIQREIKKVVEVLESRELDT